MQPCPPKPPPRFQVTETKLIGTGHAVHREQQDSQRYRTKIGATIPLIPRCKPLLPMELFLLSWRLNPLFTPGRRRSSTGYYTLQSADILDTRIFPDGKVVVRAGGTVITYQRPAFDVMLIALSGHEDPNLSKLFFELLDKELDYDQRRRPRGDQPVRIELFVDARRVTRHGLMFEAWIRLLLQRRHQLNHIHVLAVNKVIQLSVEIIRHLSDTGTLIKLYEEPETFAAAREAFFCAVAPRRHVEGTIDRMKRYLDSLQPFSMRGAGERNKLQREG